MAYEPGTSACRVLIDSKAQLELMLLNLAKLENTESIRQQLVAVYNQLEELHDQRRLERDGAEASPLNDWNLDGCVDMREFGNTVHSYFDLADKTKDGRVTQVELRGPSMPLAPPTGAPRRTGMAQDGSTTQTPTNPATGLPY